MVCKAVVYNALSDYRAFLQTVEGRRVVLVVDNAEIWVLGGKDLFALPS